MDDVAEAFLGFAREFAEPEIVLWHDEDERFAVIPGREEVVGGGSARLERHVLHE